jgi:hypothetical protein
MLPSTALHSVRGSGGFAVSGVPGLQVTASATYHRILRQGNIWASTVGWGRNQEPGNDATNALLDVSSDRPIVRRLKFHKQIVPVLSIVNRLSLAGLAARQQGIGAGASAGLVLDPLKLFCGSRVHVGLAVFVMLRPAERGM